MKFYNEGEEPTSEPTPEVPETPESDDLGGDVE
jgi:hypothetical protein